MDAKGNCSYCGGTGKVTCQVCKGTGSREMPIFSFISVYGKPFYRTVRCESCDGIGIKWCKFCNGTGRKRTK